MRHHDTASAVEVYDDVTYLDIVDGEEVQKIAYDAISVDSLDTYGAQRTSYLDEDGGWYYIEGDLNSSSRVRLYAMGGTINLIVKDNSSITLDPASVSKSDYVAIGIDDGTTLNIYAQSTGENMGKIVAKATNDAAGIGNGAYFNGGNLNIYGGDITAIGGQNGAGIGSGAEGSIGNIKIYGGKVTATGGKSSIIGGAGIGAGREGSVGSIEINGGTVVATGGGYSAGIGTGYQSTSTPTITINGGDITANAINPAGGNSGAGIGSGSNATALDIMINGGTINATSTPAAYSAGGAGIGGGSSSNAGNITINGGTITAKSFSTTDYTGIGAGIGGGNNGLGGNIIINGGTINAESDSKLPDYAGAGIGGGNQKAAGMIKITGGEVYATSNGDSAAIGSGANGQGGTIEITGGNTIANNTSSSGYSIGNAKNKTAGSVKITGGSLKLEKTGITNAINTANASFFDGEGRTLGENIYDEDDEVIIHITEIVGLDDIDYTANTDSGGMAYLWLPVGYRAVGQIKNVDTGTVVATFDNGIELEDADFVVTGTTATYDKNEHTADVDFDDTITEEEAGTISIIYKQGTTVVDNPTKAGSYDIYVTTTGGTKFAAMDKLLLDTKLVISKKSLSVIVVIEDKVEDGNATASIKSVSLNGVIAGDIVNVGTYPSTTFSSNSVGQGKAVTFAGDFVLTGGDAANYELVQPTGVVGNILENNLPNTGEANDIVATFMSFALLVCMSLYIKVKRKELYLK